MYKSIKEFVDYLKNQDQLTVVSEFTDTASGIAERTCAEESEPDGGKALLFTDTGTAYPVLTNVFSSKRRMEMVLGVESYEDISERAECTLSEVFALGQKMRGYIEAVSLARKFSCWTPVQTKLHPSCQDSIQNIAHLGLLPFISDSGKDGRKVLSPVALNSRNPKNGARTLEPNKLYILDECTAGIAIPPHSEIAHHLELCTHRLPLAACLGGDPLHTFIAAAPKTGGIDPYLLAGFFRGKPVSLTRAFTQDIDIPAGSDLVIEGYIQKSEGLSPEGLTKLHVTCITHRRGAIIPMMTGSGTAPEKETVRQAVEKIFIEPLRRTVSKTNEALLLSEEVFYGSHRT